MVDDSYYQLLGVTRESTLSEIVTARRVLAREFHPDRGGDPQHMALINSAFDAIIASQGEAPTKPTTSTNNPNQTVRTKTTTSTNNPVAKPTNQTNIKQNKQTTLQQNFPNTKITHFVNQQ